MIANQQPRLLCACGCDMTLSQHDRSNRWATGIAIAILIAGALLFGTGCTKDDAQARCAAAKATVIAEADLIAAAGKFPNEATQLRWQGLLVGCE